MLSNHDMKTIRQIVNRKKAKLKLCIVYENYAHLYTLSILIRKHNKAVLFSLKYHFVARSVKKKMLQSAEICFTNHKILKVLHT